MRKKFKALILPLILMVFSLILTYVVFIGDIFNIIGTRSSTIPLPTYNFTPEPTPSLSPLPVILPTAGPEVDKKAELAKSQDYVEDKYLQGYNSFFANDYQTAIKLENEVIQQDVTYYKAYNLKGIALCFSGNYKAGMENIDKALDINPNFDYGRFNKALAYELYGHYDEALIWYDKCLENTDIDRTAWSYYGKASIYGRKGDAKRTVEFLKLAINFNAGIKEYSKTEEDFENVKGSLEFQDLIFK